MNLKIAAAGFAIQAAQGAAEAQPAFWGPVGGGKLVIARGRADRGRAHLGARRRRRRVPRVRRHHRPATSTRVWPGSFAGLLYAVLGAVQTVGAAAPYTHTITPAAELPWCTVFGAKDTERKARLGRKLDSLKVEWEGNAPAQGHGRLGRPRRRLVGRRLRARRRRDRRELPQGHQPRRRHRPGRLRLRRRRRAAGRLGRDQAQHHAGPEVRPARAGRPLRGRLRVRRRAQGARARPARRCACC